MVATERESERVQNLRAQWTAQVQPALQGRRVFFLDESGVTTALTRLYGRAVGGRRAIGSAPKNYGKQINVLGVINGDGIKASLAIVGSVNAEVMCVFIREILRHELQAGDVVVMDNLSVHKTRRVQAEFAAAKVEVMFLPPYSPDLNPIEKCWSKMKTYLRGVEARAHERLHQEIGIALKAVTAGDADNWIRHCGYS